MTDTNGQRRIRVLVCATSAVSGAGLQAIVRGEPSLTLIGSMLWLPDAGRTAQLNPDVLLVDLEHDDSLFREGSTPPDPDIPVVALVDEPDRHWIARALRRGVKAILPR